MWAAVGFLLRVCVGMSGKVVGVVGQEGAVRAVVQLGASWTPSRSPRHARAAGRLGAVFRQKVQRAATTHLGVNTEHTGLTKYIYLS